MAPRLGAALAALGLLACAGVASIGTGTAAAARPSAYDVARSARPAVVEKVVTARSPVKTVLIRRSGINARAAETIFRTVATVAQAPWPAMVASSVRMAATAAVAAVAARDA